MLKQWGFIQFKSSTREIYFHKYFQRDHRLLFSKMRFASPRSQFQAALHKSNIKGRISDTAVGGYRSPLDMKAKKSVHIIDPPFISGSTLTKLHTIINENYSEWVGTKYTVSKKKLDKFKLSGLFKTIKKGVIRKICYTSCL